MSRRPQRSAESSLVGNTRRALARLSVVVLFVAAIVSFTAAPAQAASGDVGWAPTVQGIGVSEGAATFTPTLACAPRTLCRTTATTQLVVSATAGATFTTPPGTSIDWIFNGTVAGVCVVNDTLTLTCTSSKVTNFISPRVIGSASPFAVNVPAGLAPFTPVLTAVWSDSAAQVGTNDPANDTLTVVTSGVGNWRAVTAKLLLPETASFLPSATFTCASALCGFSPASGFRLTSAAGTTFTGTVGSSILFGTAPFDGACTVESATSVLCAPVVGAVATQGTEISLPRLAIATAPGAIAGTTHVTAAAVGGATLGNDVSYLLRANTLPAARTVFFEGFENNQATTTTLLTSYTGATPVPQTYTADPAWLSDCNGVIVSDLLTDPTIRGCASPTGGFRALAWALGEFQTGANRAPSEQNHALINFTAQLLPTGMPRVLQGVEGFDLTPGRYYAAALDIATQSCSPAVPQYTAALVFAGGSEQALTSTPISPCADYQKALSYPTGGDRLVGRYFAPTAYLATESHAAVQINNLATGAVGNDSAIDNLAVYDVTPALSKTFAPATGLALGATSRLTFTITNTDELGEKAGWQLADQLPSGLVVAAAPNIQTSCNSPIVTAAAGSGTISATGSLAAASLGCELTISVVAATAGTYANCASNLVGSVGLLLPATCASIVYGAVTVPPVTTPGPSAPPVPNTGTDNGTGNDTAVTANRLGSTGGSADISAFVLGGGALVLLGALLGVVALWRRSRQSETPGYSRE